MKRKILVFAMLIAAMLLVCGCGKQTANQEESAVVVAEPEATVEAITETAEPEPENPISEGENAMPAEGQDAGNEEPAEASQEPEPVETAEPEASTASEPADVADVSVESEGTDSQPQEPDAEEISPAAEEPEVQAEEPVLQPMTAAEQEESRLELTIPAEYAEPVWQIGEVSPNGDGSVTYTLTNGEYEALLEEVHAYIQEQLDEMTASFYFPHFDSMTANEDCTVFTVVVIDIQTSKAEQKSIPQLYRFGWMYAAYQGLEPGNIHIDYMTQLGNTFVTRDSDLDMSQAS